MTTLLLTILAGIAPAVGLFAVWWLKGIPERRRKRENRRIHNEIAQGDENAVRKRIRRARAES